VLHGDIRNASDLEGIGAVDWIIDAAALPSVMAGIDGRSSSRQLVEHNLLGTVNLLEHCKRHGAGFLLISTSRVYGISALSAVQMEVVDGAFVPSDGQELPAGLSHAGIAERFTTQAPVSLYGATKLASEALALEYGSAFGLPVWINRCGVLAGAGQFGRADQGIFSFWIHSWRARRALKYIGFDGAGHQVRDCLHVADLTSLVRQQLMTRRTDQPLVVNVGGGLRNSMSLRNLSSWCEHHFGAGEVREDLQPRPFDLPWIVMDCTLAKDSWGWQPSIGIEQTLEEIARHADANTDWLDRIES
jgi:CDP-paratose 2-epimerase